ncbi:MAG: AI-2E family transporter [Clostridiales bacterium]|nr:AI-2E family transporter [Clostridiales bacterium]
MNSMLDLSKAGLLLLLGLLLLFSGTVRGILLPFGAALLLAAWSDRPVSRLEEHFPRWLAALIVLTVSALLVLCLLSLAAVRLWQDIPAALEQLSGAGSLWDELEALAGKLPFFLGDVSGWLIRQLRTQGSVLEEQMASALGELAAGWAAALPGRLFALGVTLLAAFYAAADWKRVRRGLARLLPRSWLPAVRTSLRRGREGVLAWLRVQGRLMGITWLILAAGLGLLGVSGAWLAALVIALADALPVLGTGLFLLPWAGFCLLRGDMTTGLGLVALWLLAALCRSVLEPRLLGRQSGISPLFTLLALYAGWKLFGAAGVILGPVLLSVGMAAARPANGASSRAR